uniref:Uncharacterized protein n=1 Tax=Romanomermis culicivorax TaxID=13658 RepID=A0A915HGD5_ROMCU
MRMRIAVCDADADVGQCPKVNGKITQLLCPSRRRHGYHVCIDESALCNGHNDCPNAEDENPVNCMFFKTTMRYFKTVVDQVVELSTHVLEQSKRQSRNDEL